jgi:hypothetical protein
MPTNGDQIRAEVDNARAGSTPHIVRWVLLFGLLAAIVLLTAIWVVGAWSSDQNTQTVDAQVRAAHNNAAGPSDSVASDHADQMNAASQGQSTDPQNMPNKKTGQ